MRALDPLVGSDRFDFIADIGSQIPMRTIGYLLGIPEHNQEPIRDTSNSALTLTDGEFSGARADLFENSHELFADYIDWRADHPSDDLMTQLLNAEFEEDGEVRRLTRTEVLMYTGMVAGAGNETTTRLIGFAGQLLAETPRSAARTGGRPLADPRRDRGGVALTRRRHPCRPATSPTTSSAAGRSIPEGSVMLLLNGSANRDERHYPDRRSLRHPPRRRPPVLRAGAALLPGLGAGPHAGTGRARGGARRWPDWEVDYDNAEKAHTSSVRGWSKLPVTLG